MNMEFVTFEIAKKLKEKGFIEQCLAYYTKDSDFYYNTSYCSDVGDAFKSFNCRPNHICGKRIDAPTISQVLKWLREVKKIYIMIDRSFSMNSSWHYSICVHDDFENIIQQESVANRIWEQSALDAIEYVIDNLI